MKPLKTQDNLLKVELILDSYFILAGILASKELEILIKALCEKSGIKTWEKTAAVEFRYLYLWELVDKLFQDKIITRKDLENIKFWWILRNNLVHAVDVQISKDDVNELIVGVLRFRNSHFSRQYIQKTRIGYLANISH